MVSQACRSDPKARRLPLAAYSRVIPDREGEHADKARQQAFAPLPVAGKDHLGVGLALEGMAKARKLGLDLRIVEDLAVESDDEAVALHRLRAAGGEVDDREPRMHQRTLPVRPGAFVVRSAAAQMFTRGTRAPLDIAEARKLH
jgi:hypothetical protein